MATQINHDSIYIGGVFNGPPVSERDPSRRARIPSFLNLYPVNVSFSVIYQKFQLTQSSLYYKDGIYTRKSSRMNTLIEQKWYAHRKYRNLIVHQIELLNQEKADICMLQKLGNPSRDFRFSSNSNVNFVSWFGSTLESEGKDVPLVNVSIIMTNVNQTRPGGDNVFCKTLIRGKPFTFLAVLVTSLESSDPHRRSIDFFTQYSRMDPKELLSEHIKEWRTLKGNIHVEGDKELNNNIQTSLYYILSSIRSDWEYSLSPGSISTNTYNGHIFWDTEFWMYPILLNFYPEIAKSILNYRISRISRAEEKAKELGYKGAMFPWESAFSGIEVTPTFAETRDLEIHISGDIVVAIDDYLQINRAEKDELLKYHELSSKVADFYVSRSTKRIRQPQGFYDINLIVPPDEYAINVNNSVFTNAVAQVSMEIASKLSTRLGLPVNPLWKEVSSKLFIPFNESNQIHLEYEGYAGQKIKQADVVLLGYPLQWKPILSNPTIRKNDLYYYEPLTDQINGPAMSWVCFYMNLFSRVCILLAILN